MDGVAEITAAGSQPDNACNGGTDATIKEARSLHQRAAWAAQVNGSEGSVSAGDRQSEAFFTLSKHAVAHALHMDGESGPASDEAIAAAPTSHEKIVTAPAPDVSKVEAHEREGFFSRTKHAIAHALHLDGEAAPATDAAVTAPVTDTSAAKAHEKEGFFSPTKHARAHDASAPVAPAANSRAVVASAEQEGDTLLKLADYVNISINSLTARLEAVERLAERSAPSPSGKSQEATARELVADKCDAALCSFQTRLDCLEAETGKSIHKLEDALTDLASSLDMAKGRWAVENRQLWDAVDSHTHDVNMDEEDDVTHMQTLPAAVFRGRQTTDELDVATMSTLPVRRRQTSCDVQEELKDGMLDLTQVIGGSPASGAETSRLSLPPGPPLPQEYPEASLEKKSESSAESRTMVTETQSPEAILQPDKVGNACMGAEGVCASPSSQAAVVAIAKVSTANAEKVSTANAEKVVGDRVCRKSELLTLGGPQSSCDSLMTTKTIPLVTLPRPTPAASVSAPQTPALGTPAYPLAYVPVQHCVPLIAGRHHGRPTLVLEQRSSMVARSISPMNVNGSVRSGPSRSISPASNPTSVNFRGATGSVSRSISPLGLTPQERPTRVNSQSRAQSAPPRSQVPVLFFPPISRSGSLRGSTVLFAAKSGNFHDASPQGYASSAGSAANTPRPSARLVCSQDYPASVSSAANTPRLAARLEVPAPPNQMCLPPQVGSAQTQMPHPLAAQDRRRVVWNRTAMAPPRTRSPFHGLFPSSSGQFKFSFSTEATREAGQIASL